MNAKIDPEVKLSEKGSFASRLKNYFTTYEKWWMIGIVALAIFVAVIAPEDDANGVSGIVITVLYVFDVIIGCFCELLFSKQNKWGFLIYNIVEIIEITTMIILRTRWTSRAVAVLYWIPAHTLGFFQWRRFMDKTEKEKTVVRRLKTWQTIVIMAGTVLLSLVIGYIVARLSPDTDFYSNEKLIVVIAYLDACLGVMSILDGVLMFFRSRESWWTWYLYIIIETIVNIISGQWVLLVYKLGYFTNTTYGMIEWTKYIRKQEAAGEDG